MKNLLKVLVCMMTICVLLAGCGSEEESDKLCRIEVLSGEDGTVLKIMENMTQDEAAAFLDVQQEMNISGVSLDILGFDVAQHDSGEIRSEEGLAPEYRIILYQEKTKTVIQSGDDTYQKIMEYVTYKDSDLVKMIICGDVAEDVELKEEFLTVYYNGTDIFFANLREALNEEARHRRDAAENMRQDNGL